MAYWRQVLPQLPLEPCRGSSCSRSKSRQQVAPWRLPPVALAYDDIVLFYSAGNWDTCIGAHCCFTYSYPCCRLSPDGCSPWYSCYDSTAGFPSLGILGSSAATAALGALPGIHLLTEQVMAAGGTAPFEGTAEEEAAAAKIQAIKRGKDARSQVEAMKQGAGTQLLCCNACDSWCPYSP